MGDQILENNSNNNDQNFSTIINDPVAGPSGLIKRKKTVSSDSDSNSSGSYTSDSSNAEIDNEFENVEPLSEDDTAEKKQHTKRVTRSENEERTTKNLNTSFTECGFFVTPELKVSVKKRRPAINSKAQEVTRKLFCETHSNTMQNNKENKRVMTKEDYRGKKKEENVHQAKKKVSEKKESWFCLICNEDRIADMRICNMCGIYVHEECVGLSKQDKETFFCPKCT